MAPLLSPRDWVYSLSLLIPFVAYNLTLKALDVASQPGGPGYGGSLASMWSNIFFNLGYASLMIGLFAAARRGLVRSAVVFLFHAATILVVTVATLAHEYFRQTGTTLDYGTIVEWAPKLDEIQPGLLQGEGSLPVPVILFAVLFYAAFGPQLVTRAVGWWRGWTGRRSPTITSPKISFFGSLGLFLLAFGFGWLSLLTATTTLARDPVVNLALTGFEEMSTEEVAPETDAATGYPAVDTEETSVEEDAPETGPVAGRSAAGASLARTPQTEKRNVVLIHLESARARSVTPYNEDLQTMPFLNELAKSSLLAEHARVIVPRSSKGSTAINCGIEPALFPGPEYEPGGIPSPCFAGLLKEQGYRTVFFQSLSDAANNHWDGVLARNFGYEEFYPAESMDREGFQVTNSFGFEEDIMLGPSEGWLSANGYDKPFLAQYFTGTGHYGYDCVPNRYGYERFSENEELDRYHNCLRMLDFFLRNLFDQYKRLGLYEDTIFVLYGDHGEGFREHGRYMHGDNPYEEGLRVPLLIHAPGWFEDGERAKGLSSQIDVLPTVLEMMGYDVAGEYPGYSLLHPLPEDRTLMSSCVYPYRCMASLKGTEKYIYHYGDQPDELFDLSEDPLEERNLAGERDEKELNERRKELLAWASRLDAEYGGAPIDGTTPHSDVSREE
jgi:arylsulfatase A-like enzyme